MLSVEIKLNEETIKKLIAVRKELFQGHGAMHTYDVSMVDLSVPPGFPGNRYVVGTVRHRYCAGAVSLAGKMFKLARKKGMHT